ncbi:transposase, partial [Enterococcus sp. S153_ASV_20]
LVGSEMCIRDSIKTMKRVSYGFKSFENMRIRIFLINQLIKVR